MIESCIQSFVHVYVTSRLRGVTICCAVMLRRHVGMSQGNDCVVLMSVVHTIVGGHNIEAYCFVILVDFGISFSYNSIKRNR